MGDRSAVVIMFSAVLALALAGCATPTTGGGDAAGSAPADIPTTVTSDEDAAAQAQAEAWLAEATLPAGAVPADSHVTSFGSYQGWPCGPVVELEAFWSIPGATVSDTANWLIEHPTGDLISTTAGPIPSDPSVDAATVGYIPEKGAQEGIVYTVHKTTGGVAVRAEIAAQTASATCPELPGGGQYGAPGQG